MLFRSRDTDAHMAPDDITFSSYAGTYPYARLADESGNPQTLRDLYNSVWPDILADYNIVFIFDLSCVAGSSSNTAYAVSTGAWPGFLVLDILLDVRGLIVGKGGDGADVGGSATVGGPAISLGTNIRLSNTGIIGGGGDGGEDATGGGTINADAAGGGGAGYINGIAGLGTTTSGVSAVVNQAENGGNTLGGAGGFASNQESPEPAFASGFAGGDLGDGQAIALNGNTITYEETGTILGAVS